MPKITQGGKVIVSPATLTHLNQTIANIDKRIAGPQGKTKHGKIVRNPQAYVWGGVRKAVLGARK